MSSAAKAKSTVDLFELKEDLERVFALQQANKFTIGNTTARQRIAKLKQLEQFVYDYQKRLQQALYADFKKPAAEVDLSEIFAVVSEIRHAVKHLNKWMKPRKVHPTLPLVTTRSQIRYEPRGVVLIISPWNFPFALTMGPLVSAIAAGNCVMIKPSEFTTHTSALMKEMIEQLFPENEVALFEGAADVSTELLKQPFDHIFFTGSPTVGKIVMKAAAEHLSTVTLELGGKSPVIIDETANLNDAAQKIAWGKFFNKGQACISPDYLLVHRSKKELLLDNLKKEIKRLYGESEIDWEKNPDYARVINDRNCRRLTDLLDDSIERGAQIEIGGGVEQNERYIAPTVLSDVAPDSRIMQEEIFGPLLPVISYQNLEEALQIINEKEKPLAIYIFSKNRKQTEKIISNTSAGGTCINEVLLQFMHWNLPFGGVNHSGFGNGHGFYGFRAFSHERAILKHNQFNPLKLLYPPYSSFVRRLINFVVRYL